jgi:hypothetical protein
MSGVRGLPASHRMGSPACKSPVHKKRVVQEVRTVPGNGGGAAARKQSTGLMEARREKEKVARTDRERNDPEEAMETDPKRK